MDATRTEAFATAADGSSIHYLVHLPEAPTGSPVLVVPGFGEAAEEFEGLLEALAPRPAAAVSVRGRGKSDAPAAGYRWEDHIADLEAAAGGLGWEQFNLVAFSRGSSYALGFALRHPERVRALAVGDYEARHVGLPPSFVETSLASKWRGLAMRDRMPAHAVRAVQEESVEVPLWDRLAELRCPLLLLRPGRRSILQDETVARWTGAAKQLSVVLLAGANHDLWGSDPEGVTQAVGGFLDRADSQAAGGRPV